MFFQPLVTSKPLSKLCQIKSMKQVDSPGSNKGRDESSDQAQSSQQPLLRKLIMPLLPTDNYFSNPQFTISQASPFKRCSQNCQSQPSFRLITLPEAHTDDGQHQQSSSTTTLEFSIDDLFSKIQKIKSQFSSDSDPVGTLPSSQQGTTEPQKGGVSVYDSIFIVNNSTHKKQPNKQHQFATPESHSKNVLQTITNNHTAISSSPVLQFGAPKVISHTNNFSSGVVIHKSGYKSTTNFSQPNNGVIMKGGFTSQVVSRQNSNPSSTSISVPSDFSSLPSPPVSKPLKITDFELGRLVGSGKFGDVFQCRHKASGGLYALKKIFKSTIKQYKMIDQFATQLKILYTLHHPNIVQLYAHFEDEYHVFLLMEYLDGGTLMSLRGSEQKQVSKAMLQVVRAVEYLHQRKIAHRDIKPENIVLANGMVKLCDFGWACNCDTGMKKTFCGTLDYVSPEILEERQYSIEVDLWSLGVLAFELLAGFPPFEESIQKIKINKIKNVDKNSVLFPPQITKDGKDFIERLLKKQPHLRMSLRDSLHHSFLYKHNSKQEVLPEIKSLFIMQQPR